MSKPDRWAFGRARQILRPANRYPLDRWVSEEGARLTGLVLNLGAGVDERVFGRRVIRLDRYAPSPTVRADLAAALPFVDGSLDAIVCTEVLEHVEDANALIAEMARVLRSGGRALVTVPFIFHYHEDPDDHRRFSPPGLKLALETAGFDVDFSAGAGTKLTALFLLAEGRHPLAKALVRLALLPLGRLVGGRPRNGVWSDWAANAVAIARKR